MKRFLLLTIWTLISCTTSVNHADNVSSEKPRTNEFEDFVDLFKTRLTKIPNDYVNKYLQVDTLRFETDRIVTYDIVLFSSQITGLIYKANCTAGGLCENLVLVTFDKSGQRTGELEVRHSYADYGSSSELTYVLYKNQIELKLKETELLEADDGTDKEQVTVDTTFIYRVDLTSGQFRKD